MFAKAVKVAREGIFPIFRFEQNGNQVQLGVCGTGFFINSRGYFVSVAHAFDNPNRNTKYLFMGRLPGHLEKPPLEIKEIIRNDDLDVFIGKIEAKTRNYFWLSKNIPPEGRSVCSSGYPMAQITTNPQGGPELGGVRRYFQPSFVLDRVKIKSDSGAGKVRTHDGFLMRDAGLFGMSGGPVFGKEGRVVGMQGSVTKRDSVNANRTITVENAIAIQMGPVIELLKKNRIKFNLMGKI